MPTYGVFAAFQEEGFKQPTNQQLVQTRYRDVLFKKLLQYVPDDLHASITKVFENELIGSQTC
eukprot:4511257-Amphidinium_carterae.1